MKKNIGIGMGLLLLGVVIGKWILPEQRSNSAQEEQVMNHSEEISEEYTCAMHPQIRQNEPGDCPICGMDLVIVDGQQDNDPYKTRMSSQAIRLANVQTSIVRPGNNEKELILQGKVDTDKRKESLITSRFPGRIEKLYVDFEGEEVKAGQVLAEIYSPELIAAQKELLEAEKLFGKESDIVKASRSKLKLWNITDDQIQNLEQNGKLIQYIQVVSPFEGVVKQKNIQQGSYVGEGDQMFHLVDLSSVWIVFDLYEKDMEWVKVGDEITYRLAGISNREFKGSIAFIDPVVNSKTRTASARLERENKEGVLKPDMFVQGLIRTEGESEQSYMRIPKTAVLWTGKRSVVYLARESEEEGLEFEYREVIIASDTETDYLISEGLSMGDEIVTMGLFKVDAAAQLSGKYSMMNRPGNHKTFAALPESFTLKLNLIYDHYISMKNALVESQLEEALKYSEILYLEASDTRLSGLDKALNSYWKDWNKVFIEDLRRAKKSKDLEALRVDFFLISNQMIQLTEDLAFQKEKVYKSYCPMARNDQGGYWLSESEQIANPYFGDAMLRCGEVKKVYNK